MTLIFDNTKPATKKEVAKVKETIITREHKLRPCTIDGVNYPDVHEAMERLDLGQATLMTRFKSAEYTNYICKDYPKKEKPRTFGIVAFGRYFRRASLVADFYGLTETNVGSKMKDPKVSDIREATFAEWKDYRAAVDSGQIVDKTSPDWQGK